MINTISIILSFIITIIAQAIFRFQDGNLAFLIFILSFSVIRYLSPKYTKVPSSLKNKESFNIAPNGHFCLLSFPKGKPEILCKLPGNKRREKYWIQSIFIDRTGQPLLGVYNEFQEYIEFYYTDCESLISHNGKPHYTFDELLLSITNKRFFAKLQKLKVKYLTSLGNKN